MKILICATRMSIGGAETHVLSLARALRAMGQLVCVASSGGEYVGALREAGIRHLTLPLDKKDPSSVMKCRSEIYKIVCEGGFDIVHAHGRIPSFVCDSLRGKAGFVPVVVTVHGIYDPAPPRRRLSKFGDRVIAVSADIKDDLINTYRVDGAKICVIPNGVDTSAPAHVPAPRLRIFTASRLDEDTALTAILLCDLMPRLRRDFPHLDPTLTIVGGGKMLLRVREAAKMANLQAEGSVTVLGAVTDMPSMLARADVFVGSSRAALEAMSACVPVVLCSDAGCSGVLDEKTVLEAERTNFTCRGASETSSELLRGELERLLCATAQERTALGNFGRAYILRRASTEIVARKTLAELRACLDEKRGEIMLCGYFGADNAGDDATLAAVLRSISQIAPRARVSVIARNGGTLPRGVERISRLDMRKICAHLKKTRLFVLCGGTLIQNSTSNRSLTYYHTLCELAKKHGARVMIWGGGVGPLYGDNAADLAADVIECCDAAGIRDERSMRGAKALGIDTAHLYPSADAALLTPPLPLPAGGSLRNGHCFAVCPRSIAGLRRDGEDVNEKDMQALLVNSVRRIADKYKITPLWLPLAEEDVALCRKLCRKCGRGRVMPRLQAGEIVSLLSGCLFSVCIRLHGAVFSSCAGIPAICLPYDPKVEAFSDRADHHSVDMKARDLSPLSVIKIADHILSYRDRLCANVKARAAELRRACAADVEAARRLWEV